jgi:NAD(P)-dependent dehydrogenase (short-subunit alcohol dehydrogenase family)
MSGRVEGKRAVVTGAGMGIGRAAAIKFAAEGGGEGHCGGDRVRRR